jgi:luciferase family oxidoreductase group 1
VKFSVLDALEHAKDEDSAATLRRAIALARHCEQLGCTRYWIVEHHNVAFEACPAPEVLASALAAATSRIRIGTGGMLLNNYSPYKVAEQARTLAALFPGRIDLGFGRSISGAGPDLALMRDREARRTDDQAVLAEELMGWLSGRPRRDGPFAGMAIMPDLAAGPEGWLLAASEETAALAGRLGLRLACSGFHRPELIAAILAAYRAAFAPTANGAGCSEPQVLVAMMGVVAQTQAEAENWAMPMRMANDLRRNRGVFLPRLPDMDAAISYFGGVVPAESGPAPKYIIGSVENVADRLQNLAREMAIDEILFRPMVACPAQKNYTMEQLCRALTG